MGIGMVSETPGPASLLAPGKRVQHPGCPAWGVGQVQSVDGNRVTINFENAGKQLIKTDVVELILIND
jgi:transcription elongation factor GreA-like protein